MISIVTAYYNRKKLFERTLKTIARQNFDKGLEVIAVDDGSDEHERLEDLTAQFPFLKVIRLEKKNKWYQNSCIPFNIGFRAAKGDKVILQNPECLHFGNILEYTENNLTDTNYLSFACFSLDKDSTENLDLLLETPTEITAIIQKDDHIILNDGDAGWYNHSVHRPEAYHFCTAISKKSLQKLKGFDERFALGIAYDDNELIERVKALLRIKFVDEEIVLHQNHYSQNSTSFQNRENKARLYRFNELIYKNRIKSFNYNSFLKYVPFQYKKNAISILLKLENRLKRYYTRIK
ncbi:MAG: hypothetical protein K0R77_1321 [Chryseobacterium sp.]|jgi:glycosyltransferase involved in cell wall biosynthesis|uniref:glycosyltransferase family 2 protein n=1 Tax=Chryseobacterium sp. TaxID=1871047 RepID=UPI002618FFA2|nr:glycosyltransferase [Chryseobacterium sp.]MDF2552046.1 hypothetical protein [Chryseobacterium sp.]